MLSRRRFLETNVASLALPLASAGAQAVPAARSDLPASSSQERDYWNDWPRYLTARVNAARTQRKAVLESLRTEAQVRERIQAVRSRLWDLIGGPLEKTPLNPRQVGTIERKAHRIEKIIFESQPQVYVTAHLYVPTAENPNAHRPCPAILAPLGHTNNGKEYRNYQYVYQTLARLGYVVLAFDPFGQGERMQYLDPRTGKSRYGPTGEHSQAGRPLLLMGATFALYRVWDGIRALDYLLSRPEIDSARVGCTGHSGGGTMTMYLCALEPRIGVAVEVEGNSENLAGPQYDPPGAVADAEQNVVAGLALAGAGRADSLLIDRADLLMAFAPKPLLISFTPQDSGTTYSPNYSEGTREVYDEVSEAYGILGAKEKVELFASPLPHDFDFLNRQACYRWFNRWLGKNDLGTEEAEFESSPDETLNCTSTGQVLTSLGGRSVLQLNIDMARAVEPRILHRESPDRSALPREAVRQSLERLLGLPGEKCPLDPQRLSLVAGRGMTMEEFDFHSEPEIRVPGWFVKPTRASAPLPTVVVLSEDGKDLAVDEPGEIVGLVDKGFALCAIDVRGLGICSPRYPRAGPLFYGGEHLESGYAWAGLMIGKPVIGQCVWDFMRVLDYLETRSDVDRGRIIVVGHGGGALVALMGSALEDGPRAIALGHMLSDYRAVAESEEYNIVLSAFVFGILREMDLPDIVASIAPRPCLLMNVTGPRGEILAQSAVGARYKNAVDYYSRLGAGDRLQISVQPDRDLAPNLLRWLESF